MLLHDKDKLNTVPSPVAPEPDSQDPHETGGSQNGFQLPRWVWMTMIGSYVVFFTAITAAVGHNGSAIFAIVVSIGYVIMFFGLAAALNSVRGREKASPLTRGKGLLQTWGGTMNARTVAGQVLVVPVCIALFAVAILIVRMSVVP